MSLFALIIPTVAKSSTNESKINVNNTYSTNGQRKQMISKKAPNVACHEDAE